MKAAAADNRLAGQPELYNWLSNAADYLKTWALWSPDSNTKTFQIYEELLANIGHGAQLSVDQLEPEKQTTIALAIGRFLKSIRSSDLVPHAQLHELNSKHLLPIIKRIFGNLSPDFKEQLIQQLDFVTLIAKSPEMSAYYLQVHLDEIVYNKLPCLSDPLKVSETMEETTSELEEMTRLNMRAVIDKNPQLQKYRHFFYRKDLRRRTDQDTYLRYRQVLIDLFNYDIDKQR